MLNKKILIKYILLEIPDLAILLILLSVLSKFFNISTCLMITIIFIWIAKDIILFPKVWKAYDSNNPSPIEQLIGMEGIVMHPPNPVGYIKVKGELWKAEIRNHKYPVSKGDEIKVCAVKGTTLIIEKVNPS